MEGPFLAIELGTSIYSRLGCAVSGYLSAAKLRATVRVDLAEQADLGRIDTDIGTFSAKSSFLFE
jgi:hypothetical protein